jgi:hypothetical protein
MYEVTVRNLTMPLGASLTVVEPGYSVAGVIVQLSQKRGDGEGIPWEYTADDTESEAARTVYPGWKRDRAVLLLALLVAGFLVGLGVGKRTHDVPTPAPTPAVTIQPSRTADAGVILVTPRA